MGRRPDCNRCGAPRDMEKQAYCKACRSFYAKEWRRKNPEKARVRDKRYKGTALCSRCGEPRTGSHKAYCKICAAAYRRDLYAKDLDGSRAKAKAWHAANPDKQPVYKRRADLKNKYGLTEAAYAAMIEAQGGVCAICKEVPTAPKGKRVAFHVDHDHSTGQLRALLCSGCNTAIGHLKESPDRALAVAWYLIEHQPHETKEEV